MVRGRTVVFCSTIFFSGFGLAALNGGTESMADIVKMIIVTLAILKTVGHLCNIVFGQKQDVRNIDR